MDFTCLVQEVVDVIHYIRYGHKYDKEYYSSKICAKQRQLRYLHNTIKNYYPGFAGIRVIEEHMLPQDKSMIDVPMARIATSPHT